MSCPHLIRIRVIKNVKNIYINPCFGPLECVFIISSGVGGVVSIFIRQCDYEDVAANNSHNISYYFVGTCAPINSPSLLVSPKVWLCHFRHFPRAFDPAVGVVFQMSRRSLRSGSDDMPAIGVSVSL